MEWIKIIVPSVIPLIGGANRDCRALVENHNISGDESRDEQS